MPRDIDQGVWLPSPQSYSFTATLIFGVLLELVVAVGGREIWGWVSP